MATDQFRVLVLGGYGNFGKRICETLVDNHRIHLLIAGRNKEKAARLCVSLIQNPHRQNHQPDRHQQDSHPCPPEPAVLDINSPHFAQALKDLSPQLVIHTSGPFQGQDFRVPEACIAAGTHYIDLADDRRFVCDIDQLNNAATAAGVLLVSGASSVPGLSSTVIDHFLPEFEKLEHIEYGIAPGNKLERGAATIQAILSYTGHPFNTWENETWKPVYGWMDSTIKDFGHPVGKRRLANIDIPDLELFPQRYSPVKTVRFGAGLELGAMHEFMVFMAWLVKKGVVKNWSPWTPIALAVSKWFYPFGTDIGGMMINMKGTGKNAQPKNITWRLIAEKGIGPYIPTLPAILVARKLVDGSLTDRGATPCLGLFQLEEFTTLASQWGIYSDTN